MGAQRYAEGLVMDVSPWSGGVSFRGTSEWWDYILTRDEQTRVNQLLGMALLDESVQRRLVDERDESLMAAFNLSEPTRQWLRGLDAATLPDFAQAVSEAYRAIA